jgi:hypothetical protein
MKRIITIVALICAVTFQVNAQNTAEENKKNAEHAMKLADENPDDGLKQYAAAAALTNVAIDDKSKCEQALAYAQKALKIAQAQKELKDTLLANSYSLIGNIYMLQRNVDNACDYMELSIDAVEKEFGRYDPVTIYYRLKSGLNIISLYPDTRRGFLHIMQAFYDNDKAPADKRIKNLEQLNIRFNLAMEQMLAAYTNMNRNGVPVVMKDGVVNLIVQTRDWHIGQPLVNWLTPNMLRSEEEKKAHWGEGLILMTDNGEFHRLTKEEGQKVELMFPPFFLNTNSNEMEITPGASFLFYLNPQSYEETVKRFEEFKSKEP